MQNKHKQHIRAALLLVMIICMALAGRQIWQSVNHKIQSNRLKQLTEITHAESQNTNNDETAKETEIQVRTDNQYTTVQPVIMEKYAALHERNSDMAGWLSIEGTVIDYPVMQCDDNEYYLNHNFYKENDKYGCLYVKDIADVNTPGTNIVIYGHDMRDGSMFGNLDLYERESYYREHQRISFNTLYEERTYEIAAVFISQVYYKDQDVFKYYSFYNADTQEEFEYFYNNIKALSLYDTGVSAKYGDTFITLSTCAYHVEDGRFVVVAKRLS